MNGQGGRSFGEGKNRKHHIQGRQGDFLGYGQEMLDNQARKCGVWGGLDAPTLALGHDFETCQNAISYAAGSAGEG